MNLIQEALTTVNSRSIAKQITISTDVESSLIAFIEKDGSNTFIRNLMNNALMFPPKGGTVYLSSTTDSINLVSLKVSDTGFGDISR